MQTESQTRILGTALISANEFQINRIKSYIVKRLLLCGQVSMLCGAPNTGKSAILACVASHVAMGRDFGNHRVRRAAVVYVAAEDPDGIGERAWPYMKSAPQSTAPFRILPRALNLSDGDEVGRFISDLRGLLPGTGCDDLLVILDTLNLCLGDGDENSARDMSRAIGNAQRIARTTGAHVLIAHHTSGHDGTRPRGSTAMDGNTDTMLILHKADESQPEGVVFIAQQKQRSVVKGAPIAFQIEAFDAGTDSEGDPITVPMAVPFAPRTSLAPMRPARTKAKASSAGDPRAADVRRVLSELSDKDAAEWHDKKTIGARTGVPFNDVRDNADSLRKAVKRALDALTRQDVVECSPEGTYRLTMPSGPAQESAPTIH